MRLLYHIYLQKWGIGSTLTTHSLCERNCGWEEGKQYIFLASNIGWEYELSRNLPSPYIPVTATFYAHLSIPGCARLREIAVMRTGALVFFHILLENTELLTPTPK